MGIRTIYILAILLICTSCDNTDYQVLEINSKKGLLEVLNSDYVIDSIAFEKDNKLIFSMSLKDKIEGSNKLNLKSLSSDYEVHESSMNFYDCKGAYGIAFVRQKGFVGNIDYDVQQQKKHYQEIQQFWFDYSPCQDSIVRINALRKSK